MKLITGGAFQGKTDYAQALMGIKKEEMEDGASCVLEALFACSCMNHFHEWVKRALEQGIDLEDLEQRLEEENPDLVVITNELGYGVVPVEQADRTYRELHGRICCRLAAQASEVHRVVCGIGMVIKHG